MVNILYMVGKMYGSFGIANSMKSNNLGDLHRDGRIIQAFIL